jgi:tripartite-type tricarboxylate transporter receptor subunit TctC
VEAVKAAPPDGDLLLLAPQGPMTLFPYVYKTLRFDPAKDFTPLGRVVTSDFCLAVAAASPPHDAAGFRDWAKTLGDRMSYGSPGAGTIPHFLGVQIARGLGITMTHVPYRGGAPAVLDLAAGTVQAVVTPISDPLELHKAGKLRVLATTGAERSRLVAGIPTLKESGIDIDVTAWYGLYGPAGLAPAVAQKLQTALAAALRGAAVQERLARLALVAAPGTPAELTALQKRESAFWGPVVKASGFTPED